MGPEPTDHSSGVRGLKETVHIGATTAKLYKGDCLLLNVPDESIDLILCDLPYGTTKAPLDKAIASVVVSKLW